MIKVKIGVLTGGGDCPGLNNAIRAVTRSAIERDWTVIGIRNGWAGVLAQETSTLTIENTDRFFDVGGTLLGSSRTNPTRTREDYAKATSIFGDIGLDGLIAIGGDDTLSVAGALAGDGFPIVGVPKTIDNDLVKTDHCPGYGSVLKYICSVVRETALDHGAMGQHDLVSIMEVMGRNAGWIAAGATLAKRRENPNDAPHLIYLPELPFSRAKFIEDVQAVLKKNRYCLVVVGEGLQDKDGNYVANSGSGQDAFGHVQLGGVGDYLANLVEENLTVKARSSRFGTSQRAAAHCSSSTDNDEAFLVGQAAVRAAVEGETDQMVILVREEGEPYQCTTGLAPLNEIANGVKEIPEDWISEDGVSMSAKFIKYAQPLIQGEVEVPYENGLPEYVRLSKRRVRKVLDPHTFE